MTNEVRIGGVHNQIGTINQAETINITEKPLLRELKERLDQTLTELEVAAEGFPRRECLAVRKGIAGIRRDFRGSAERMDWFQAMLEQMTCLETEAGLEKVPKLVQFLLLLQTAHCTYTLESEQLWRKVYCSHDDTLKKFSLFDSRGMICYPIRIIGPQVVRFLLENNFPIVSHDLVLVWGNEYGCAGECKNSKGILPTVIANFTDADSYRQEYPSFFDEALGGQLHITCGTCLMDIYRSEKGWEILERMLAL